MADNITYKDDVSVRQPCKIKLVVHRKKSDDVTRPVLQDITKRVLNDVEMPSNDDGEDQIRPTRTVSYSIPDCARRKV